MVLTNKKVIAVENSTWNNIGDAFYQISLQQMLSDALPNCEVVAFDGPPKRAFRPRRFIQNSLDVRGWVDADHYVFSGPILGATFLEVYGALIRQIHKRGCSYSLLSVHAEGGIPMEEIVEFLRAYPPQAIHTRDHTTYQKIRGLVECEMDGNCFAFFVSRIKGIPHLKPPQKYICSSFHSMAEPTITIKNKNSNDFFTCAIEFEVTNNKILPWKFSRHLEFRQKYPTEIGGWQIVRPVHSFYPLPHLIFSRQQSYITYNPINFLAIYKYCQGVITDRVHAGVAALSFGHPACVLQLDSRYELFEAGQVEKHGNMLHLPKETLDAAYERHLAWLKSDFIAAIS